MRALSGIKPTGTLHLGNYFGAAQQFSAMQQKNYEGYYFIADYHTLNTLPDPAKLSENTWKRYFPAVACSGSSRARFHPRQLHADGTYAARPQLQGKNGEGGTYKRRAFLLSAADDGRHSALQIEHRSGRKRPEAAC